MRKKNRYHSIDRISSSVFSVYIHFVTHRMCTNDGCIGIRSHRRGYLSIWHLIKIEGCCYFHHSFFFSILLIYSVIVRNRTSHRVHMSMNIFLPLLPFVFFNPQCYSATFFIDERRSFFFLLLLMIYDEEKTECVCSLLFQDTRRRQT